jgi:hypothetical protein
MNIKNTFAGVLLLASTIFSSCSKSDTSSGTTTTTPPPVQVTTPTTLTINKLLVSGLSSATTGQGNVVLYKNTLQVWLQGSFNLSVLPVTLLFSNPYTVTDFTQEYSISLIDVQTGNMIAFAGFMPNNYIPPFGNYPTAIPVSYQGTSYTFYVTWQ